MSVPEKKFLSDIEIAQANSMKHIRDIANKLHITEDDLEMYGKYKAKLPIKLIDEAKVAKSNLILVTALTPTPAGEGKTTVSIGLTEGLNKIGKKAIVVLREPSLGPVFGIKGGAAGGGYSQVVPMEDINLHFTGDFHAIGAAHNLLSALLDNHIHWGNQTLHVQLISKAIWVIFPSDPVVWRVKVRAGVFTQNQPVPCEERAVIVIF